jgi:methionine-rich copper-binding protein CopC
VARIIGLLALLLLVAVPAAAGASALAPEYRSSDPADGEKLHEAPETVTITFSEPVQEDGSTITISDHCGNRLDDKNLQVSLTEMSVGVAKTPAGHYEVEYVATGLAGATGSTEGSFGFTVHAGKTCSGTSGGHHDGHGGTGGAETGGNHGAHGGGGSHDASGHDAHGSTSTHSGGGHSEHAAGSGADHGGMHEAKGHGHGDQGHGGHHKKVAAGNQGGSLPDQPQLAGGETPLPRVNPDSIAVLLALLLAAGFGVLGGWVLRVSAPK